MHKKEIIEKLPNEVEVSIIRSKDSGFCAKVQIRDDILRTQAETFSGLIEMVNDAIYAYFEVPKKYLPDMPAYIPPVKVASKLNLCPIPWYRMRTVLTNT